MVFKVFDFGEISYFALPIAVSSKEKKMGMTVLGMSGQCGSAEEWLRLSERAWFF